MNNFFINSGLIRDGQLELKHQETDFVVSQLVPNEALIINFQLLLAEFQQQEIHLVKLLDLFNNKVILRVTLLKQSLALYIYDEIYEFQIQSPTLYKSFPIFIAVFQNEIELQVNCNQFKEKLKKSFAYQGNRVNVRLGSNTHSFTGLVKQFQVKFIAIADYKMAYDLERKQQKELLSDLNELGQIKYRLPFSQPLYTIEELAQWKAPDDAILPIQEMRQIVRRNRNPIIICHDMNNGYKEDIWSFGNKRRSHSYRFNYLTHCDIFIYFSHNLITIPTIPYINICHQFGTQILGTIITEGDGEQNQKLTDQILDNKYADILVAICKFYKFDGYLLNFETNVNPEKMISFNNYFREQLESIGAILIYYDSHLADGQLKWQSCLNNQNIKYFQSCNNIFLDYHWNLDKLAQTAQNAANQKDKVYVGIDIWGRGQYGGGQFESCSDLINSQAYQLSTAFFGQAWSYETTNSVNEFLQKDSALWLGKSSYQLFDRNKNQWTITANGGQGWKIIQENGEDIAISSFDWCIRTYTVQLNVVSQDALGRIQFSCKVRGTGPKYDDFYLLGIELYNAQHKCISSIDSFNNKIQSRTIQLNQFNIAEQNWKEHNLVLRTTIDTCYVKIIEVGKDAEFWAGNYGAQFSKESIVFVRYNPQQDMISKIKPKVYCQYPLQTYFNLAVGENYYIDGQKQTINGFYDNLNDYDYTFCYPTKKKGGADCQDNWEIDFHFGEAWNGSNCLKLKGELKSQNSYIIKLYKCDIKSQENIICSMNTKYFDKKNILFQIVIKYSDKQILTYKPTKQLTNKGWDYLLFNINNNVVPIKSISIKVTNLSNSQQFVEGLIGGFSLNDEQYAEKTKQVDFKDPTKYIKNIQLKESITSKFDLYLLLEFNQEIWNLIKTIRVFNETTWIGNFRSNYAYFPELQFDGKEMFIKLQIVLNNGNHVKVDSILPIIVYQDQIVRVI